MTGLTLTGQVSLQGETLFSGSLSVGAGWTCLMGASGAGKTTLLRLLAGLPVAARLKGSVTRPDRIGWMAQDDLLQPHLTVAGNVGLIARLAGQPVDPARIEGLLDRVGLAGFGPRRPDTLSGGQRQRVALARALAQDAPCLLLDEPFATVDPATRAQMQSTLRGLLSGRAVLMVTHDPAEALRLADRLLVLSGGRVHDLPLPLAPVPRDLSGPDAVPALSRILLALGAA